MHKKFSQIFNGSVLGQMIVILQEDYGTPYQVELKDKDGNWFSMIKPILLFGLSIFDLGQEK